VRSEINFLLCHYGKKLEPAKLSVAVEKPLLPV